MDDPKDLSGPDCSTAGKGFARTEGSGVVAEDCAMPDGPGKGFAKRDDSQEPGPEAALAAAPDCATAGKGFARTDGSDIVAEDCAMTDGPDRGYAKRDDGRK